MSLAMSFMCQVTGHMEQETKQEPSYWRMSLRFETKLQNVTDETRQDAGYPEEEVLQRGRNRKAYMRGFHFDLLCIFGRKSRYGCCFPMFWGSGGSDLVHFHCRQVSACCGPGTFRTARFVGQNGSCQNLAQLSVNLFTFLWRKSEVTHTKPSAPSVPHSHARSHREKNMWKNKEKTPNEKSQNK